MKKITITIGDTDQKRIISSFSVIKGRFVLDGSSDVFILSNERPSLESNELLVFDSLNSLVDYLLLKTDLFSL